MILNILKGFIPKRIFNFFAPVYHYMLVFLSALVYRFPSRKVFVLGVTGTKGKTSILEIINSIFEEAGYKTALVSTLRFKMGKQSKRNEKKMTTPGRFFIQKFLRRAVNSKCQFVLLEMTSQGVLQYRHKFLSLDAMIFTNLTPEHIEAHGSFEKYREAKLKLFKALEDSFKKRKTMIVNADDENAKHFLRFKANEVWLYGLLGGNIKNFPHQENLKKINASSYRLREDGIDFVIAGRHFFSPLLGKFNLYNILASVAFAKSQAVGWEVIKRALEKFVGIPGRLEFIEEGQDFRVVIDYAHTPESLEKVYELFQRSRIICVLGAAGGGRDKWKRKEMGRIADAHCDKMILTNEDPYDEDPYKIIDDILEGVLNKSKYDILISRREAIAVALNSARTGDTVIVTGKGTDPFIVGPKGSRVRWDDRQVARQEIIKLLKKKQRV